MFFIIIIIIFQFLVDGMWGSWTKWTACSKTCGHGTRYRKRFCNSPKPTYNGKICLGIAFQKKKCYVYHRCPGTLVGFTFDSIYQRSLKPQGIVKKKD